MFLTIAGVHQHLARLRLLQLSNEELSLRYTALLNQAIINTGNHTVEALLIFVEAVLSESMSLLASRLILTNLIARIAHDLSNDVTKILAPYMLEKMEPRSVFFEDQCTFIRQHLGTIYEKEENWNDAISMLVGIPLESGHKQYTTDFKIEINLKIVRLYLEINNSDMAELYINKVSILKIDCKNVRLLTKYTECYARVLDYKGKFIEAAQRYNEVSYTSFYSDEVRMTALKKAFICTTLAPAGKSRIRMMGTLIKDERCQSFPEFSILEKMHLGRLLRVNEISILDNMLYEHQKKKTDDGTTALDLAIAEHNLIAVSKLYKNIKIEELGRFLRLEPLKAELLAGKMISEGHIEGSIDQVSNFINFTKSNVMNSWDNKIKYLCDHVNHIMEMLYADPETRTWMNDFLNEQMSL